MFKKSQCRHCGKILHGYGIRVHVASVHPEAYARSRSVKAHRSPPPKAQHRHTRSPAAAWSEHSPEARDESRKNSRPQHADRPSTKRPRMAREETTQRIWQQVQTRTT